MRPRTRANSLWPYRLFQSSHWTTQTGGWLMDCLHGRSWRVIAIGWRHLTWWCWMSTQKMDIINDSCPTVTASRRCAQTRKMTQWILTQNSGAYSRRMLPITGRCRTLRLVALNATPATNHPAARHNTVKASRRRLYDCRCSWRRWNLYATIGTWTIFISSNSPSYWCNRS